MAEIKEIQIEQLLVESSRKLLFGHSSSKTGHILVRKIEYGNLIVNHFMERTSQSVTKV